MKFFTIHSLESAAPKALPILEGLRKMVGFVPNVFAVMGGTARNGKPGCKPRPIRRGDVEYALDRLGGSQWGLGL